jgi:hypothetical protein
MRKTEVLRTFDAANPAGSTWTHKAQLAGLQTAKLKHVCLAAPASELVGHFGARLGLALLDY